MEPSRQQPGELPGPHVGQPILTAGPPPESAACTLLLVHGRGASAESILAHLRRHPPGDFSIVTLGPAPLTAEEERALKPKEAFRECDKCPETVMVPAGTFTMGGASDEEGVNTSEVPQHRVVLGQALAVGRFSITFDEWDACVADGGCNRYRPDDKGWGRGLRPVINVSWNDANA